MPKCDFNKVAKAINLLLSGLLLVESELCKQY